MKNTEHNTPHQIEHKEPSSLETSREKSLETSLETSHVVPHETKMFRFRRHNPFLGLSAFNWISIVLGMIFLYIPTLVIVLFSFSGAPYANVWGGWSLRWYLSLLSDNEMLRTAWNSLQVAFFSATLATVFGVIAGISWARRSRHFESIAQKQIAFSVLFMPESVIGLTMLLLFTAVGIDLGKTALVIAHATLTMCFVGLTIEARMFGVNNELEEAATDLGCHPRKVFFLITVPTIMPAVVAGWLLAFTISLDEFIIAVFVAGANGTTMPIEIFSRLRLGVTPVVNAAFTITILLVVLAMALSVFLQRSHGSVTSNSNP